MLDCNGIEIKTGDVVCIEGAYFKNDNGYWLVSSSPRDPGWFGSDYALYKLSAKTGKLLSGRGHICFWPIKAFTNDRAKNAECREWNAAHATIRVVNPFNFPRFHVREYFRGLLKDTIAAARRYSDLNGDAPYPRQDILDFLTDLVRRMNEE